MRLFFTSLLIAASTTAQGVDDSYFTVTCTAHMVERASGRVDHVYDKTRGGSTYEEARELAEENVLEACAMDAFRFNYQDTHACRLITCDQ